MGLEIELARASFFQPRDENQLKKIIDIFWSDIVLSCSCRYNKNAIISYFVGVLSDSWNMIKLMKCLCRV